MVTLWSFLHFTSLDKILKPYYNSMLSYKKMFMNFQNMLNLAKNKAKTLVLWGLVLGALSFAFLIATQKSFKATTDLLVVQNQTGFTDYYALSKSADFLTGVLSESVYSEKFLDEINKAGVSTATILSNNKLQRLKDWEKMVKISRNPSLGTIHIEVLANTSDQASSVAGAIVKVLTDNAALFLGNGQDLDVRVLNTPTWESNPSLAQIIVSVIGGFLVGMILSFMVVYYREARKNPVVALQNLRDEHIESLDDLK
jgi:capsular polysaccharide biosynthesis protein